MVAANRSVSTGVPVVTSITSAPKGVLVRFGNLVGTSAAILPAGSAELALTRGQYRVQERNQFAALL